MWYTEFLKNYGWRFMTFYSRRLPKPSPRKRNARRQSDCLRRPYKELRKEEKQTAREKGKVYPAEGRATENSKERKEGLLK